MKIIPIANKHKKCIYCPQILQKGLETKRGICFKCSLKYINNGQKKLGEFKTMTKENEVKQWLTEQKRLLELERIEEVTFNASKKSLKSIREDIKKNNEWLRKT